MYQNHFIQFSRLGAQGLGTNEKYIRYASVRFLFFKLTQPALQKIKQYSLNNGAFTKIEAVLIDVYVSKSSPFSSSFYKGAFLLLESVVWCRRKKNVCERYVPDRTSLSGLPLRESIINYDRNWFRTVSKYE